MPVCRSSEVRANTVYTSLTAGVGDPALRAVDDPVVAVAHRPGGHRRDVAAGVGLRQRIARLDLARRDPRHVRPPELLGAEVEHRQHPELGDQEHAGSSDASTRANSSVAIAWSTSDAPDPPYSSGYDERGQLHRPQRLERRPRVLTEAVGLGRQRGDLVGGELSDDRPELALLLGQGDRLRHGFSLTGRRRDHQIAGQIDGTRSRERVRRRGAGGANSRCSGGGVRVARSWRWRPSGRRPGGSSRPAPGRGSSR